MLPEKSKGGRPSVACASCRAARRACDGKFADCVKYVSLPATASDAAGPSQPASPPPSRPVRSKMSPGGSEHRGAPVALAAEPAYSPVEELRNRPDRRYDLKQRRTSVEAVVAMEEQLASAGWAADAVIEADGRTRSGHGGLHAGRRGAPLPTPRSARRPIHSPLLAPARTTRRPTARRRGSLWRAGRRR